MLPLSLSHLLTLSEERNIFIFCIITVGRFQEVTVSPTEQTSMKMDQAVIAFQGTATSRVFIKADAINLSSLKMGLVY